MTAALKPAYQHLQELRARLGWCALALGIGAGFGYVLRGPVIGLLEHPLGQTLFYTSPMGSFDFVMRICLLVGFLAALPVMVYQALRFIEPALPKTLSLKLVWGTVLASLGLAAAGVAFGYLVSLPAALHFFNQVGTGNLHALITADQYFSFVINYLCVFAAVFQLPLLLLFINRITPLGPHKLRRFRKYVIVGSFAIALISPSAPDPLSQIILALPIIALYEVSIVLVRLTNRGRFQAADHTPATVPAAPPPLRHPAPRPPRPALGPLIDLRDLPAPPALAPHPIPHQNILDLRTSGGV